MARFEPFVGTRYNPELVDLDTVTAPPYDVISETDRELLEARSPYNAVRVELARDGVDHDRYTSAQHAFDGWMAKGVLGDDDAPSFYAYAMTFSDEAGSARRTLGVIGALGIDAAGEGAVLPHERTMPKPKGDRLNLLRACRANLSPIWGLSPAAGLSDLCSVDRAPDAACVDEDGIRHELWRLSDPADIEAISATVAREPVVIADGHHRYETAIAYRQEVRDAADDAAGDHDLVMTLVVELVESQLSVRAIHRLISGLPDGFELREALQPFFDVEGPVALDAGITPAMVERGAMALVLPEATFWLVPRDPAQSPDEDLDSIRLDRALAALPPHEVTFQHGWSHVATAVETGTAQAGVLLRPARVDQIAETSRSGIRMPQKTTFFHPKPRTGLVFRRLAPPPGRT